MCVFTRPVSEVSSTAIFARRRDQGRQILVYQMALASSSEVAMVLPLPVPPRSAEDAVQFMDFSDHPNFFDDLDMAFPVPEGIEPRRVMMRLSFGAPLVVHEVGCFEASFVPTRADFSRLDHRFRLSDDAWRALPNYNDWGFAVFKLRPMARRTNLHPMAFEFPQRHVDQLFFPTVHIHNEQVEPSATFDHMLYCQDVHEFRRERWCSAFRPRSNWQESSVPLSEVFDSEPVAGVVLTDRPCHRISITGSYANVDVVI